MSDNPNTPAYWDEVYRSEREANGQAQKRRIDSQRLEYLVNEMRDWWIGHRDVEHPTILDVGCGDGEMLRRLHAELPAWQKSGVDFCAKTIERNHHETPCFEWRVGDIYQLDLEACCDVLWCGETLEHLADPERALARLARAVRPGGYLCCSVPNEQDNRSPEHLREFSVWDCLKLTERYGATRVAVVRGDSSWHSVLWTTVVRGA